MLVLVAGFAILQYQRARAAERAEFLAKQRAVQIFIQPSAAAATTSPTTRRGPTFNHRGEEVTDEPSR